MEAIQLRFANELLISLASTPYGFGSLDVVGHVFEECNKYGEARFKNFGTLAKPFDDITREAWDFVPMVDNPVVSWAEIFPKAYSLADEERKFIRGLERSLNYQTPEMAENYYPSVYACTQYRDFSVILEVLDKATNTRIGSIKYDPQKRAYTFNADCIIQLSD